MKRALRVLTGLAFVILAVVLLAGVLPAAANPAVFINEIHYDNTGTDSGEAIEIAGPAGTDLAGWSIVLYNGNGGAVYNSANLSGVIPDLASGFGFVVIDYPVNGIQNGSPDGLALVDATSTVVQFLSYEGTFTAVGGPADGLTSTDIGVSESGSGPVGNSLQLAGTGTTYDDFTWSAEGPNTFGAVNTGQVFSSGEPTPTPTPVPTEPPPAGNPPVINEFSASTAGTDVEYIELFGDPSTDYSAYTVLEIEGDGSGAGVIDEIITVGLSDTSGFYLSSLAANSLENGTLSLLLVSNFSGALGIDLDTNNDGVFELTPWDAIVDSVAVNDGGSGDLTYGVPTLGPNFDGISSFAPGGASRIPDGFDTDATSDWVRNDFDLAGIPGFAGTPVVGEALNTPGEQNQVFVPEPVISPPVINEFSASTTGTDVEYIELFGDPDTHYSAYTVLEIEGDSNSTPGVIDEVIPVGTTDSGGFWLYDLPSNALENGTISLLLVKNFTGAFGDDLDTNDDGFLNVTPWDAIVDSVAVSDGGSGDLTYGVPTLAPNYDGVSSFAPGGASRIPDGFDTDTASDWVRNDFDLAGIPGQAGTISVGEAYNTPGAPNEIYIPPPEACGDPFTPIYAVQGNSATSPLVGTEVAIEGVVVGDFQNNASPDNGDLNGFHVQDPSGDGDPATSDGIFVYAPGGMDVSQGDAVRVRGSVSEFNGLTEISASQIWGCTTSNPLPAPAALSLPVTNLEDFEPFEGMLVTFPQSLYISEYFNFDRFGEIVLTPERLYQPTASFAPGSPAAEALADENARSRITLDDGRSSQNPDPAIHPNGNVFDLTNLFRGGDIVQNVTGVMDYAFGLYRIQPTQGADYTAANLRPTSPDAVGGEIQVASFNVLNYFTTLDNAGPICGPLSNQDCRGADNDTEFTRQRDKIISALAALDADIVGVIEIENHPTDEAMADLVAGLNDAVGAGTYAYIETGPIGTDAIKVGLLYKPARVTPSRAYAILDSSVDATFLDDKNRPVLAQTFESNTDGALLTVAVNHLKSKGSDCLDVGDPDTGDGQGNCNLTRTAAAHALVGWLATDPTGSGDGDALIIGDLNSYDHEDPISALLFGGYTDLVRVYQGEDAYTYVFDGQLGYLDDALANLSLLPQVTGLATWHINADEPDLLDYDTSFKQPAQDLLYEPNAYRSSDHDPVLVGLNLNVAPDCGGAYPSVDNLWPVNHKFVAVEILGITDADGDTLTVTIESIFQDEPVNGTGDGSTAPDAFGYMMHVALLRAERDGGGNGRVYHVTFRATDPLGYSCTGSVQVSVPLNQGKKGAAVDDGPLYDSMLVP